MDGHFVPNLTMGPAVVASLARTESLPLDCHLMVTKPELLSEPFARAGADIITLHIETLRNPAAQLADLKRLGVEVGLTLRPSTPLSAIEPYLSDVDLVLVMTVEPGFSGQTFMQEPANRVRWLRQTRQERSLRFVIEVDGGVGPQTVEQVAWADVLVCGNALFRVPDIKLAMDEMRQRALAARRRDLS
jgi:ribulose-phosphate 3-epimerase